jgi:hypothetical protein
MVFRFENKIHQDSQKSPVMWVLCGSKSPFGGDLEGLFISTDPVPYTSYLQVLM